MQSCTNSTLVNMQKYRLIPWVLYPMQDITCSYSVANKVLHSHYGITHSYWTQKCADLAQAIRAVFCDTNHRCLPLDSVYNTPLVAKQRRKSPHLSETRRAYERLFFKAMSMYNDQCDSSRRPPVCQFRQIRIQKNPRSQVQTKWQSTFLLY